MSEMQEAKFYSVLCDETADIANQEQFSVCIRWVDSSFTIHGDVVELVHVPNIKGETLFLSLKDILMRLNLPLELCRGQAYDGAANMQGEVKGLATRFAKENPSALQVHCLAHCLNLCVQDVARQCSSVRDALDLVQEILQLFKLSPKRDA